MPLMDGYEVARRICSGFTQRRTMLVALTVWARSRVASVRATPGSITIPWAGRGKPLIEALGEQSGEP